MDVVGVSVYVADIRSGCAVYPVSALTKTTGLITNPRRVLGSRNRVSEQLCLMPAGLYPRSFMPQASTAYPAPLDALSFLSWTLCYKSSA